MQSLLLEALEILLSIHLKPRLLKGFLETHEMPDKCLMNNWSAPSGSPRSLLHGFTVP